MDFDLERTKDAFRFYEGAQPVSPDGPFEKLVEAARWAVWAQEQGVVIVTSEIDERWDVHPPRIVDKAGSYFVIPLGNR